MTRYTRTNHVLFLAWMKWRMAYHLLNYKEIEGATYLRGKKNKLDLDITEFVGLVGRPGEDV